MKQLLTLLSVLTISIVATAQNFQTIEEVNDFCPPKLGFATNEEAEIIVEKILDEVGLSRNFVIQECPKIKNAIAKNIEITPKIKQRYIFYDNTFFERINNKANTDWASISILAHEIGHHLSGHALNNQGSTHKFELEADEFSGFVLAKMGATLQEAQSAIQTLRYEKATATHPAKADRLIAIKKGYTKAKKQKKQKKKPVLPAAVVETHPLFPECKKNGDVSRRCFNREVVKHIQANFRVDGDLGSIIYEALPCKSYKKVYNKETNKYETVCQDTKKAKIYISFKINSKGNIVIQKIDSPHPLVTGEALRVFNLLPKFVPATQNNKPVTIQYTMPITIAVYE